MNAVTTTAAIIAVTELIKRAVPQVSDIVTIIVAAVIGGFAGFFGVEGLNTVTGVLVGLSAAGVHTVATKVGGK